MNTTTFSPETLALLAPLPPEDAAECAAPRNIWCDRTQAIIGTRPPTEREIRESARHRADFLAANAATRAAKEAEETAAAALAEKKDREMTLVRTCKKLSGYASAPLYSQNTRFGVEYRLRETGEVILEVLKGTNQYHTDGGKSRTSEWSEVRIHNAAALASLTA